MGPQSSDRVDLLVEKVRPDGAQAWEPAYTTFLAVMCSFSILCILFLPHIYLTFSLPLLTLAVLLISTIVPSPSYLPTYGDTQLLSESDERALVQSTLPLDSFQLLGTHNSCHRANAFSFFVKHWRYSHPPLTTQLDCGIRHIEIDLWFNMTRQRWEVFHETVDPLTNCKWVFTDVLRQIREWCDSRMNHFPLIINLDIKGAYNAGFGLFHPFPFGRRLTKTDLTPFQCLQREVHEIMGDLLYSPAHLLRAASERRARVEMTESYVLTVEEAVSEIGWPAVCHLKGKVLFQLNLYQERSACVEAVDCRQHLWVRSDRGHENCLYTETRDIHCTRTQLSRRGLVRTAILSSGTPSPQSRAEVERRKAAHLLEDLHKWGTQLIASNHPEWLGVRAVRELLPSAERSPAPAFNNWRL